MEVPRYWRFKEQRYKMVGNVDSDGNKYFPPGNIDRISKNSVSNHHERDLGIGTVAHIHVEAVFDEVSQTLKKTATVGARLNGNEYSVTIRNEDCPPTIGLNSLIRIIGRTNGTGREELSGQIISGPNQQTDHF